MNYYLISVYDVHRSRDRGLFPNEPVFGGRVEVLKLFHTNRGGGGSYTVY